MLAPADGSFVSWSTIFLLLFFKKKVEVLWSAQSLLLKMVVLIHGEVNPDLRMNRNQRYTMPDTAFIKNISLAHLFFFFFCKEKVKIITLHLMLFSNAYNDITLTYTKPAVTPSCPALVTLYNMYYRSLYRFRLDTG